MLFAVSMSFAVLAGTPAIEPPPVALPPDGGDLAKLSIPHEASLPNPGGMSNQAFGSAVTILGDRAIVGAQYHQNNNGRAWSYRYINGAWDSQGPINPPMGVTGSYFGTEVFLFAPDRLVVGAREYGPDGYVATYAAGGLIWTLQQQLVAPDGTSAFGRALAVDGERMLVADNDFVFFYVRENDSWQLSGSFEPPLLGGAVMDLALDGDRALVGASVGTFGAPDTSWVYVYGGGNWVLEDELVPSFTSDKDHFGSALSLRGDVAAVGAPDSDEFGLGDGAAYIFEREDGAWVRVASLHETVNNLDKRFGYDVLIVNGLVLVGAPGVGDGRVYVYAKIDGTWQLKTTLTQNQDDSSAMGSALGSDGARLIVGAPGFNPAGAARIYRIVQAAQGEACGDGGDCANGLCADGVCCDSPCGGDEADCLACSVAAGAMVDGTCVVSAAGAVCRAAGGACDVEELCDGVEDTCPKDGFHVAGFECRPAPQACDVPETCPGDQAGCPADMHEPDGSPCADGMCQGGACEPAGTTDEGPLTTGPGSTSGAATTDASTSGAPTTGDATAGAPTTGEPPSTTSGSGDAGSIGGATAAGSPTGEGGCGCSTSDRSAPLLAALAWLLAPRRRRRRESVDGETDRRGDRRTRIMYGVS